MRIGSITPCRYTHGKLEYVCFIKGNVGWSHHQGPYLFQFPDDHVAIIWGAYDIHECSNDSLLLYSVSKDGGEIWSDPEVFMSIPGSSVGLKMLRLKGSGNVLMLSNETTHVGEKIDSETKRVLKWSDYSVSKTRIILRESLDDGNTWNFGMEIPPELIVPDYKPPLYGSQDVLMQLKSGKILMVAMYLHPDKRDPQHYYLSFLLSDNNGKAWHRSQVLTVPEERGAMEPVIVELEDDHLYCLIRTKSGFLYETSSYNGGETWKEPVKTNIPSPEAMCKIIMLQSGSVLLVWNNVSSRTQHPRYPLVCTFSGDGCKSWSKPKLIATEFGKNQLSNFGIIQLNDGRILLSISHYHAIEPTTSDIDLAIFDEEWVKAK